MTKNPYLAALKLVKRNVGTDSEAALAKCIVSLYNPENPFGVGEILKPLDSTYSGVVMDMLSEYLRYGETDELREAGRYVLKNFPGLIELSNAMLEARGEVHKQWARRREEKANELYPNG